MIESTYLRDRWYINKHTFHSKQMKIVEDKLGMKKRKLIFAIKFALNWLQSSNMVSNWERERITFPELSQLRFDFICFLTMDEKKKINLKEKS